ncbi:hypothetical protein ATANTOWER_025166, partial [Ataeniobius toweri]|nr:hypothetical protein [Ataeniobius toweri]
PHVFLHLCYGVFPPSEPVYPAFPGTVEGCVQRDMEPAARVMAKDECLKQPPPGFAEKLHLIKGSVPSVYRNDGRSKVFYADSSAGGETRVPGCRPDAVSQRLPLRFTLVSCHPLLHFLRISYFIYILL